jgi:hypothetical protein
MPPIPDLQAHNDYSFALLPDGVYPCDEAEFRAHFVEAFGDSQTRQAICDGFFQLWEKVAQYGIAATQWVDGSFVEGKPNPGDVDVVSFCEYDFLNNLDSQRQQFVIECLKGSEATKAEYWTPTFLVPSCPVGHPYPRSFRGSSNLLAQLVWQDTRRPQSSRTRPSGAAKRICTDNAEGGEPSTAQCDGKR